MGYLATTITSARPSRATRRPARRCGERLEATGEIYLGHYEGWYAVRDEAFYGEDELTDAPDGDEDRAHRRAGGVGEGALATSSASRPGRTGC